MTFHDKDLIIGSKGGGGGKGKGSGGGASNASNTLRSKARARMIEAISEGPCEGIVDGAKGIFFEQTAVQNTDGSFNFKNVNWQQRYGTPDQEYLTGFPTVETPYDVNVQVKVATGPVTRTINETNADAVRVIVQLPSLVKQNKDDGSLEKTSVSYAFELRPANGTWVRVLTANISNQKTTSPVQRAHRIELPFGGCPWDLRMVRLTADSSDDRLANDTHWESYTVLVEGKFTYPNTALVAMEVNAEDMGQNLPSRAYRFRGLKTLVPSNYDPIARTYTGIWDGTFKIAWHSNPAWVFYDLIVNDRYGLGEFIDPATVDKWSLYQIARYCDEPVKSGFVNPDTGAPIMEPRYTFNGVIRTRDEAFRVLQNITTTWRGMAYWSLGQVFATADMPEDPVKLLTPANVINGEFTYSGTAMKARHSVCLVSYQDPDDFYQSHIEVVVNDDMLRQFGWREKELELQGATSRGLARRYGEWVLDTEMSAGETVECQVSWEHVDVRPGNIVAVADPRKAAIRLGGRIAGVTAGYVDLDAPFLAATGETYKIMLTLPDGSVKRFDIQSFTNQLIDEDGTSLGFTRANLAAPLDQLPLIDSSWVMEGTDIQPRQYRVVAMSEEKPNIFKITAIFHDPNKYARVERGVPLVPKQYTRPTGGAVPPTGLKVSEVSYVDANGRQRARLTVSWDAPNDYTVRKYEVAVDHPTRGYFVIDETDTNSMDLDDVEVGEYTFFVAAISYSSFRSDQSTIDYEYVGFNGLAKPNVTDVQLIDGGTEFTGRNVAINWKNNYPTTTDVTADGATPSESQSAFYAGNIVKVYESASNTLLRSQTVQAPSFGYTFEMNEADSLTAGLTSASRNLRFEIVALSTYNKDSDPASLTVTNPLPELLTLTTRADGKNVLINWKNPTSTDFAGIKVWVEENDTFDPLATTPFYVGTNDAIVFPGEEVQSYYIRIGAFDTFGDSGMQISPAVLVTTGRVLDTDEPAVPTGLTLQTTIDVAADGTTRAKIIATVTPNAEEDLAQYVFQIREGDGNYVAAASPDPHYEWFVAPGRSYGVRARAADRYNNVSDFCDEVTIVAAVDDEAPGIPVNPTAITAFRSIWLNWDRVTDGDLAFYEVEATHSGLATILIAAGPSLIHPDLTPGDTWQYRIRAVDTSFNRSDYSTVVSAVVGAIEPGDLPPDAIVSSFALIDEAFIESAHIKELDAAKIKAGSVLAGTVIVATSGGNIPLADIGADGDPAETINNGTTQIEPGKIKISGSVSLADWRLGSDLTSINGGAIGANTIAANSLIIGMRGISTDGITFEHNKPATNNVSWTTGRVRYIGDDGNVATRTIAAGSAVWSAGYLYLIWLKGGTTITTTTDAAVAFGINAVILGIYAGGKDLTTNYGQTIIDGSNIKTGTISATSLSVTTLSALSADLGIITAGKAQSVDGKMQIDLDNKRILIAD